LAIQFRSLKVNSGEFRRFEVAQTGGPRHTAAKNSQTDSPELSLNKRQVPLSAAHECGHAAMGMELPKLLLLLLLVLVAARCAGTVGVARCGRANECVLMAAIKPPPLPPPVMSQRKAPLIVDGDKHGRRRAAATANAPPPLPASRAAMPAASPWPRSPLNSLLTDHTSRVLSGEPDLRGNGVAAESLGLEQTYVLPL
jgi:hypothetical protein